MSNVLNKIGKDLVLALVNEQNRQHLPQPLTFAQVHFSNPQVISVPTSELPKRGPNGEVLYRNTRVAVTTRPGAPFVGSRVIEYHRIDVALLFKPVFRKMIGVGITSSLDLIQLINNRFGLFLEATDVVIEPIDTTSLPTTYTLKITPECYSFVGQVELELIDDLPDLEELIQVNLLDGFHYAPGQENNVGNPHYINGSGQLMAMWGAHSVSGATMYKADNGEAESFVGVFNSDLANVAPVVPVDGHFEIPVGDDQKAVMAFGLGLLSELRGNDLTELYTVTLEISRADSEPVETAVLGLKKDINGQLVWEVNGGLSDVTDNAILGQYMIQTLIDLTTLRSIFFAATSNSVEQFIGLYHITLRASAKRAIYVNDIVQIATVNFTNA